MRLWLLHRLLNSAGPSTSPPGSLGDFYSFISSALPVSSELSSDAGQGRAQHCVLLALWSLGESLLRIVLCQVLLMATLKSTSCARSGCTHGKAVAWINVRAAGEMAPWKKTESQRLFPSDLCCSMHAYTHTDTQIVQTVVNKHLKIKNKCMCTDPTHKTQRSWKRGHRQVSIGDAVRERVTRLVIRVHSDPQHTGQTYGVGVCFCKAVTSPSLLRKARVAYFCVLPAGFILMGGMWLE